MGFSGELGFNIAEMHLRGPLKPIYTNSGEAAMRGGDDDDDNDVINAEEEDQCGGSTTPTARIPIRLTCPPPPRKKKPSSSKCNYVREFFTPPDLESVFILRQHVERSN